MAAKGTIAKENIAKKIAELYGENYLGKVDNKYYVNEDDGGQKVQIAISLTCPKTQIETAAWDMPQAGSASVASTAEAPAAISQSERETIDVMLRRLGL